METVSERISADPEEIQKILDVNKSLSVALVAMLLKELRTEVREGFAKIRRDPRVDALEERINKQKQSLLDASVKFHKMEQDIDELRKPKEQSPPPDQPHDEEVF